MVDIIVDIFEVIVELIMDIDIIKKMRERKKQKNSN